MTFCADFFASSSMPTQCVCTVMCVCVRACSAVILRGKMLTCTPACLHRISNPHGTLCRVQQWIPLLRWILWDAKSVFVDALGKTLPWNASGADHFRHIAPWKLPQVLMDSGLLMYVRLKWQVHMGPELSTPPEHCRGGCLSCTAITLQRRAVLHVLFLVH